MKSLISILAVTLALAFTGPAFAGLQDTQNKGDCQAGGGTWDDAAGKCGEGHPPH
jgi:hypothetical protein